MEKKTLIIVILLFLLGLSSEAYANIVFPAISHQFTITVIIGRSPSLFVAILILLVEAMFIKKLLSMAFLKAFALSFLVNLITSVIGFFLLSFAFSGSGHIFTYGNMKLGTYLGLIPGYILTVLIEGFLIKLLPLIRRKNIGFKSAFKTVAIMNAASYAIIFASVLIADLVTKGGCFKTY
jgi:hypothetical protein